MSSKILTQMNLPESQVPTKFIHLVPHLIEDFCRLRRSATNSNMEADCNRKLLSDSKKNLNFCNDGSQVRQIEIELYDDPIPTAEEKIALPRVRKLMDLKSHPVYTEFSVERKRAIEKLIKKSKQSEFRQISLIKDLQQLLKTDSFLLSHKGREDLTSQNNNWLNSMKRKLPFKRNSKKTDSKVDQPKSWKEYLMSPSTEIGSSGSFGYKNKKNNLNQKRNMLRNSYLNSIKQREDETRQIFKRLSKPKPNREFPPRLPWTLTKALRSFTPSQRLLEISKPKKDSTPHPKKYISIVKKSALQYNASSRLCELATPTYLPASKRRSPFEVSKGALSAAASHRISELASPRKRVDRAHRKDPFRISRKALYARTSRHIRELAQPKMGPMYNRFLLNYG